MKRTALLLAALACALAAPASATTVLQVDVPEMTQTSEWVLRAHVSRVTPVDLRPDRGLFTDVELQVREAYKGQPPATYTLRLPGGTGADGISMIIPGMPRLAPGEDVVLFLEKTSLGHIPCGLGQGVWRVAQDGTGQLWVDQSAGGVHLMRRSAEGRLVGAAPVLYTRARTLNDLVAEIYAAQLP